MSRLLPLLMILAAVGCGKLATDPTTNAPAPTASIPAAATRGTEGDAKDELGFSSQNQRKTVLWLHEEYAQQERAKSNDGARAPLQKKTRAKLDALVGKTIVWQYKLREVRKSGKDAMRIVFEKMPGDVVGRNSGGIPSPKSTAQAVDFELGISKNKYDGPLYISESYDESDKIFKGPFEVPSKGDVLTAVDGDFVTITGKIAKAVELMDTPAHSYRVCFVLTDTSVSFKKK